MAVGGDISAAERLQSAYQHLVGAGALSHDPAQAAAIQLLGSVAGALENGGRRTGFLGLGKKREKLRGAYIWGEVGRGKTMLMDLFFETVQIAEKRRVHFHEFMDEVHTKIAAFRAESRDKSGARDPIPAVVAPIAAETRLICFDEFHVTDITNAMLLQRLFSQLFDAGVVMVATSNVAPDHLYENGLNRQLFTPFIALLKAHAEVLHLKAAEDYRRAKFAGREIYHFGTGKAADKAMDEMWEVLSGGQDGSPSEITSLGRRIKVPCQAMGAARFDFADLCEVPLGARDYLRIAHAFHSIVIEHVPQFDRTKASAAKRFIQLVDTLYDRGVRLAASFAVPLEALSGETSTAFEFQRCVSRLIEMQSDDYLEAARRG